MNFKEVFNSLKDKYAVITVKDASDEKLLKIYQTTRRDEFKTPYDDLLVTTVINEDGDPVIYVLTDN